MSPLLREMFWRLLRFFGWELSSTPRMTVLLYHSISDAADFHTVSPKAFEEQMRYLKQYVDVVPLSRAFEHAAGKSVERNSVAVTFDDGYRDFIENAQPILVRYQIPATVFVLGDADRRELGNDYPLISPDDISRIDRTLIDIGSHGFTHRKLSKLSFDESKKELRDSRDLIRNQYGTMPTYLAYPKGSIGGAAKAAAKESGFAGAVSVIQRGVHEGDDIFALPRMQIDAETSPQIFWAKLTIAADWYYATWKFFH